jgi:uncharacterized protein YacL
MFIGGPAARKMKLMWSADFVSRLIGMVVFTILGARLGIVTAEVLNLSELVVSFVFGLTGILSGLILTPWLTVRPVRRISRAINEQPIEVLFTTLVGLISGLLLALLLAYPLSLTPEPIGDWGALLLALLLSYVTTSLFRNRAREIWGFMHDWLGIGSKTMTLVSSSGRQYLLDTSILIDGRIVDIARTGFIDGTLVVPRFVINELHRVADSSDPQRRNRGRRGLAKLNDLQRDPAIRFRIIDDDIEEVREVDDKLIALGARLSCPLLTIDFPLNQIAKAQGVEVLNINMLANAVRSAYIPGEVFPLRILQEGREVDQGVGYLDDGTMVIVERGKEHLDRTIYVEVTKLINKEAGRIIFARPSDQKA